MNLGDSFIKSTIRLGIGFCALLSAGVSTCSAAADPRYTNTIAQISAYIDSEMAANNIPGLSIALVDDQTIVWSAGFGKADREAMVAADADTVYHIGSCSKAFLGSAYMQLRDQGRVDIETNLTAYMPEFSMSPRFTNAEPVTIRSLLNHHSGLPGDFFNGMVTTRTRDDYPAWLIDCLQNDYPFAPVKQRNYYCNSGFVLLSDVVRRIAGTSFPSAMNNMLFTPLGMQASSFLPDKAAISNRLAAAYNPDGIRQPPEILNALGSGSMYSSVNDLTKYIQMILADGRYNGQTLISSNGIDTMVEPQWTNLPLNVSDDPQGLGWDNVNDYRLRYAGKVFWKDGATYLHSAFLAISRDLKLGVAVLQNTAGSQCDTIGIAALYLAILDKQGADWRTNSAYVPPFSPVTNWPQENLDALAGLYVGHSGYHKVAAMPGSLTLTANADTDTPTIFSNLVPRSNGWFSTTNSQSDQFAFTNLAEHAMLVRRQANGAFETASPMGEHYLPAPLSEAWNSRTNRVYRMVDMYPTDYFWEPGMPVAKTLRFRVQDGALLTCWMLGTYVEEPQNDNLAFQYGVHYRKGGAVQVSVTNGLEIIRYSSFLFIDEAAIPTLPVAVITNGSIPFANGTQWYWFTAQTGITYRVRVTAPGQEFFVRVTDRDGHTSSNGVSMPVDWTCPADGTYAIAVSATNVFDFTAGLTVCGSRQAQNDYDGDGKADPAAYRKAEQQWRVAMSSGTYAPQTAFMGTADGLECSADYDGDGKADPAVYDPAASQLLVRCSTQAYGLSIMPIGDADCVPVCGDFDGDRKADPALYSALSGRMAIWFSGSAYAASVISLGGAGWSNASEDYDGDGKTDPAVFKAGAPAAGAWQILVSGNRYAMSSLVTAGGAGVVPAPGDYDGDGKADPTAFQPATGIWILSLSSQGYALTQNNGLGNPAMEPRPADYDNDGKTDLAVYDPLANVFYAWLSGSNYAQSSLVW